MYSKTTFKASIVSDIYDGSSSLPNNENGLKAQEQEAHSSLYPSCFRQQLMENHSLTGASLCHGTIKPGGEYKSPTNH